MTAVPPASDARSQSPLTWTLSSAGEVFDDPGAPGGSQAHLWSEGTATTMVSGAGQIRVLARGQLCEGAPTMYVSVDGRTVGWVDVHVTRLWGEYRLGDFTIPPGDHEVVIRYSRDLRTGGCDRNLHLGGVAFEATPAPGAMQHWAMDGNGVVIIDSGTPGRSQAHLWSNGTATTLLSGSGTLTVYAQSQSCEGYHPRMQVLVDGASLGTVTVVNWRDWWAYPLPGALPAGEHEVTVRYLNDMSSERCDRNLRVGGAAFSLGDGPATDRRPTGDGPATDRAGRCGVSPMPLWCLPQPHGMATDR